MTDKKDKDLSLGASRGRKARFLNLIKTPQIPQYRVECPHCEMVQTVAAPEGATADKDHEYDCISCGRGFTIAPFKDLPAHERTGRERLGPKGMAREAHKKKRVKSSKKRKDKQ